MVEPQKNNSPETIVSSSDGKPTILFVTTRLGGGGAEKHLVRIANALVDRFNVHIAVLRRGGSYEELVRDEIKLHHVGPNWASRSTLASAWFGAPRLAQLISDVEPSCLISFLEPASWATHFARLRSKRKMPHLVGVQNNFTSAISSFRGSLKSIFKRGIENAIRTADGIIAISDGVGKNLLEHFPDLDKNKITTIYNAGFEKPPELKTRIDRSDRRPNQLVACGRLTEQKGFEDLLKATQLVSRKMDVGLWILGVGPLEHDLKKQANLLGIESMVSFVGFQADPLPWFAGADLFVLSSRWEGFGNVIVEAMSVSTAVISTACPHGPDEIIDHGCSGYLVPVSKPEKLADGIVEILSNAETRQRFELEGTKRAQDFSARLIANHYANLIYRYVDN